MKEYIVSWNTSEIGTYESGLATGSSFSATNLTSNTAYVFNVTAKNEAGYGQTSDQSTAFITCKEIILRYYSSIWFL